MKGRFTSAVLYAVVLFFCCNSANAYYYKQYTTSNHLISNNVYHSLLDSKGYIWFFTDKGISKFDGENFRNFTILDGLGDNEVFYGHEDKSGRLWLYTHNGVPCFIKNDSVYNPGNCALLKKFPVIQFIDYVYEAADSTLYFCFCHGQVFTVHQDSITILNDKVTTTGFGAVVKSGDTLKMYCVDRNYNFINGKFLADDFRHTKRCYHDFANLLAADSSGISIFSADNRSVLWKYTGIPDKNIIHLYYDGVSAYVATNDGLEIIRTSDNKKSRLFEHLKVSCTSQDKYGNYWITTLGFGVFYLNKNDIKPLHIDNSYKPITIINNQIFSIKGQTVYYFGVDSTQILKLPASVDNIEPLLITNKYFIYISNDRTYCLIRAGNRIVDLSGKIKNVVQVDENTFTLTSWFTLNVVHFGNTGKYDVYEINRSRVSGYVCSNTEERKLYFICDNKIYCYNFNDGVQTIIDGESDNLFVAKMFCMGGNLILLTNSRNIICYDIRNNYRKSIISSLPFACYDLNYLEDLHKLVISTNLGYYIASSLTDLKENYNAIESPVAAPDLLSLFNDGNNIICNLNGEYFFFSDTLLNKEKKVQDFFIDDVEINNQKLHGDDFKIKDGYHNHISISTSGLKFNNLRYNLQYRIISDDTSQWYTVTSNKIDLFFGKFGKYLIDVRTITENNMTSRPQVLSFGIIPPFYSTFPFYSIVFLIAFSIVIFSVRLYHRYKIAHFTNELNYMQLEYKAINSIMNPHFIFNAINNIQNLINTDHKEKANNYLVILSRLIRQNIDNLQFNFISVSKEINLIKHYIILQNLRYDYKIRLIVDDMLDQSDNIYIPPLLIQTFVENSVVHGFKKNMEDFTIRVELRETSADYLTIKVIDNGVGFAGAIPAPRAENKVSLGIDFTKKRLARLSAFYNVNYRLDINTIEESGQQYTEVSILIFSKFRELKK